MREWVNMTMNVDRYYAICVGCFALKSDVQSELEMKLKKK